MGLWTTARIALVFVSCWTVLFLVDPAAEANDSPSYTGDEMLKACPEQSPDFCRGFVVGFLSAVDGENDALRSVFGCVPDDVTVLDVHQVFMQHLRDHRYARHEPAEILLAMAIQTRWKCAAKSEG